MSELNPMDYIRAITDTKVNLFEMHEITDDEYPRFYIDKYFSNYVGTILYCNEVNIRPWLNARQHFEFYFNSVNKGKRAFVDWYKPEMDSDLESIMVYYGYNRFKASEIYDLLSKDQLDIIKSKTIKGGRA